MSVRQAIALLEADLPRKFQSSILEAASNPNDEECSGSNFSFWRHTRLVDLKCTMERRLKMTENKDVRKWLSSQIDLLKKLGQADPYYQGYVIDGRHRHEFAVAPSLQKSVTYTCKLDER